MKHLLTALALLLASLSLQAATSLTLDPHYFTKSAGNWILTPEGATNALNGANVNLGTVTATTISSALSASAATYLDAAIASQTNSVSGRLTLNYCTNGSSLKQLTTVLWVFNGSGSDQTLTLGTDAAKWRTNFTTLLPTKFTNGTVTKITADVTGPTATSAQQTNVYIKFDYYK